MTSWVLRNASFHSAIHQLFCTVTMVEDGPNWCRQIVGTPQTEQARFSKWAVVSCRLTPPPRVWQWQLGLLQLVGLKTTVSVAMIQIFIKTEQHITAVRTSGSNAYASHRVFLTILIPYIPPSSPGVSAYPSIFSFLHC